MNIQVLDCTLRDGGYVNNWNFGQQSIHFILSKLQQSHIDIIECGYLNASRPTTNDSTQFSSFEQLARFLPKQRHGEQYVAMIDYGHFPIEALPCKKENTLDGIRICFHKKNWHDAITFAKQVSDKGYLVFLQPMVINSYSDSELLDLIDAANTLMPFALYFADSFGVLRRNDVFRLFFLLDRNLDPSICIGYHAHNNLQLAYSNAQALLDNYTKRSLIIDCSVFGMGRGAGNLNTELFVDYLNTTFDTNYHILPLLQIVDEELSRIYAKTYWGYSLPFYLSSVNYCHPNYARYLSEKNTLSIQSINRLLSRIPQEQKSIYSADLIESLYLQYQNTRIDDSGAKQQLKERIADRTILLLAPGSSIKKQRSSIQKFIQEHEPVTISINTYIEDFPNDFIFFGNQKRFENQMENHAVSIPLLISSNIQSPASQLPPNSLCFNYENLIVDDDLLPDASGPMLIRLLASLGIAEVSFAGADGYVSAGENYYTEQLEYPDSTYAAEQKNIRFKQQLLKLQKSIKINFITSSSYWRE